MYNHNIDIFSYYHLPKAYVSVFSILTNFAYKFVILIIYT